METASSSFMSFGLQLSQLVALYGDRVKREKYFLQVCAEQALVHISQGFSWLSLAASRVGTSVEEKVEAEKKFNAEEKAYQTADSSRI